jgi:hypothetical protein
VESARPYLGFFWITGFQALDRLICEEVWEWSLSVPNGDGDDDGDGFRGEKGEESSSEDTVEREL